jgi:hypothetical protein
MKKRNPPMKKETKRLRVAALKHAMAVLRKSLKSELAIKSLALLASFELAQGA